MKSYLVKQVVKNTFVFALFALALATSITAQDFQQLPLGSSLPLGNVEMEDISGRNLSLNAVKGENGLLVLMKIGLQHIWKINMRKNNHNNVFERFCIPLGLGD